MSLEVKIQLQEEDNSFLVFECTGNYSGDNRGGFGPLNDSIDKIDKSFIEIQGPSDTKPYPYKIDCTGSLPNKDGLGFEILPIQIGQDNDELESGKYNVRLTHIINKTTGGQKTVTGSTVDVFIKNISCCIDKHIPSLNQDCWKDPKQKLIIEMSNLLMGAKNSIECGFFDDANKTIDYLKSQCKCHGCKNSI